MIIEDIGGVVCNAPTAAEIEEALKRTRVHDGNCFWLHHPGEKYPVMSILVRGASASLNFLPSEGEAGVRSEGDLDGLEPGEVSVFYVSETEEQEILNDSIVPYFDAVNAAKEFSITRTLPTCLKWFEL